MAATLRQPTPEARRPSGGRYVALTTDLAVTTDDDGRIGAASPELCALLQVPESRLVGRRVSDVVHPDDRVEVERAQLQPAGDRQLRVRLRRHDASYTWMSVTASCPNESAGSVTQWAFVDITPQVQLERRLVELSTTWSDVFNTLREGVIVIDQDGITVAANTAAADFLGVDLDDLHGSLARAQVVVMDENGLPMSRERLPSTRAFRTGRVQEEQVAYRRRDGTTRWLHARVVPLTRPPATEPDRVAILLVDAVDAADDPPVVEGGQTARTALTPRELDVLQLLARGLDINGAAVALGISLHTARGHLKQIMQKLDARSQLQAVVFAARAGLIRIE